MQPYITHDLKPLTSLFRDKNDRPLYTEHRRKLVYPVWDRLKSKAESQLVTLSSSGSSSQSEEKDSVSPTRADG